MSLVIVFLSLIILVILIAKKINPMLALLFISVIDGLLLNMPVQKIISSITNGIANTLGSLLMVVILGAMLGKIIEDSGATQKIIQVLIKKIGYKKIQWALMLTGFLVGLPMFYQAAFVVLVPLVLGIAGTLRLNKIYIGLALLASLSVTQGFLPPHPGPVALVSIFGANIGKTLIYGIMLTLPIAIIAGIIFPKIIIKNKKTIVPDSYENKNITFKQTANVPSTFKSFLLGLLPVILISIGTVGIDLTGNNALRSFFIFISNSFMALLISLLVALFLYSKSMTTTVMMQSCAEGIKHISPIVLIIASGGAFKQILVDSGIGEYLKQTLANSFTIQPLIFAWLIAAIMRICLGSATLAGITAAGILVPFLKEGVSPELMVLATGAGSLTMSHVNDTGFWMCKEYFELSLKQTFLTWTLMETLVSILGLIGVLLMNLFI